MNIKELYHIRTVTSLLLSDNLKEEFGTDGYSRLLRIAGELDVLIQKEEKKQNEKA